MKLDLDIWDRMIVSDMMDLDNQKYILDTLTNANIPNVTKYVTMGLPIWDDEIYDMFIVNLCLLIEKQQGQGYSLMILKSSNELQEGRTSLWNLLK